MDLMYPGVSKEDFKKIFARRAPIPNSPPPHPICGSPARVGGSEMPLIVTCRDVGGEEGWGPLRKELLELGITGGGTHVDIEVTPSPQPPPAHPSPQDSARMVGQVEAPAEWKQEMVALARKHGPPPTPLSPPQPLRTPRRPVPAARTQACR